MKQEELQTKTYSSFLIRSESCVHEMLSNFGFKTNYRKTENLGGYDIVAIKDGYSFLIEHKKISQRRDESYRFSEGIKGEIIITSFPDGQWFPIFMHDAGLTKSARFMNMLKVDLDKQI